MNKIKTYNAYVEDINENILSSISSFLKTQYNKIFPDATQSLNNLFNIFTKKVDTEKNVSNLYQRYIKQNQTIVVNEINKAENIDAINKIVTEEIKYFYFSLKPIVNKLQNDEFTIQKIFERSRDKRLLTLMSYPEDQFSNAVSQYTSTIVLPQIKTNSGIEPANQVNPVNTTNTVNPPVSENKIFEATEQENLISYKKSAINWLNISLFDLLKPKMQLLNKLGSNAFVGNSIDQLSKQMKGTTNDNAKKMILNKVMNLDKVELQNLANMLKINPNDLGKL